MNKGVLCKFQQTKGSVQENFAEQMAPGESYKPILGLRQKAFISRVPAKYITTKVTLLEAPLTAVV